MCTKIPHEPQNLLTEEVTVSIVATFTNMV